MSSINGETMDYNIEGLIKSVHKELKSFIFNKVNNESDADDILQDVYVKLYMNLHKTKDLNNIKSWIYKITRNTIIDYYRKKKPVSKEIDDTLKDISQDEDKSLNKDFECCLAKFIYLLSESDSDIISRYYFNKDSHKNISEKLNITDKASKMRLSRAKKRLKILLEDCCNIESDKYGNIVEYNQKEHNCNKSC